MWLQVEIAAKSNEILTGSPSEQPNAHAGSDLSTAFCMAH